MYSTFRQHVATDIILLFRIEIGDNDNEQNIMIMDALFEFEITDYGPLI